MVDPLVDKLLRNANTYSHEAEWLAKNEAHRDNRHLGSREARLIADLLREAAQELTKRRG